MLRANVTGETRRQLAPEGTIRVAINAGNRALARIDPPGSPPAGPSIDIAREIGRQADLPVRFVAFPSAARVIAALDENAWDIAFLAIDPGRAERLAFTDAYLGIEGTYLVRADSSFSSASDVDTPGVTVAVAKDAAYDLHLSKTLKSAELLRCATPAAALELFERGGSQVAAGVRESLAAYARDRSRLRVLDDRFMVIEQGIAIRKQHHAASTFLREFVAEAKAAGVIARILAANAA